MMINRIGALKTLDASLGPLLVSLSHKIFRPRQEPDNGVDRILFIRPGGMGDAVVLMPAIAAVKAQYPEARIHVLGEKRNAGIFSLSRDVDRVFLYDRPMDMLAVLRLRYNVVIDTEQWHRLSAVVARMLRAPLTVGFGTNERRRIFTHTIPYGHDFYEVKSFLDLIAPLAGNVAFDQEKAFLAAPSERVSGVLGILKIPERTRSIVLFPGGTLKERRWGESRFRIVAEALRRKGYCIIVVGGKEDAVAGRQIIAGIPGSFNLCGKLSIREASAVLQGASLLISNDSGIMHLGYAVGTRVVALFGPGIEKKWAPRSNRVIVLNKYLPCSPCTKFGYTPKCRKGAVCMSGISPEDVLKSAERLLEQH